MSCKIESNCKMKELKEFLINFIWDGDNLIEFERWLYEQDSIAFEKLIGEINYLELISFNYKNKTIEEVKKFIKTILPENLIVEFEDEFLKKRNTIRGTCVKNEALNYGGKDIREWDLEIGKEYYFLTLRTGIKNCNHKGYVQYINVDKDDLMPSGLIPISLFRIDDLNDIPDVYVKIRCENGENFIEPKSMRILESEYIPTEYSFWEDYYNDDKKALDTYKAILEELGLKKVW